MIKGNYLIRKFKGKKYYLNLENSEDISYTPPLSYNENFKFTPINRNINYFILHINDTCNMCCSYCFEKEKKNNKMQLKTIYELIDFINTEPNVAEKINIRFFGGEPLLRINFIEKIINLLNSNILNKKIKYNIFTNGILINDKVIKMMSLYDLILFISIDGIKKVHDKNRRLLNGKATHSIVEKNIKKVLKVHPDKIITRSVLNFSEFENFIYIIEYLSSLGVRQFSFVLPWGEHLKQKKELKSILKVIDNFFEMFLLKIKNHEFDWIGIHPLSTTFFSLLNNDHFLENRVCGAGYEAIAIGTDSNIYPCHAFIYDNNFKIGTLKDMKFEKNNIIGNLDCTTIKKCKFCDIRFLCKIRCHADNYLSDKDIQKKDNLKCYLEKYCIDSICKLLIDLKNYPKEKRLISLIEKKYRLKEYV